MDTYERKYSLPIERPVRVRSVERGENCLRVVSDQGTIEAKAVVSCTGTWNKPYFPEYPGRESYRGHQLHSALYVGPNDFTQKRVLIVGGGNSGAQILAELSTVAHCTWVTEREPTFLNDDVDGRVLFAIATERYHAKQSGRSQDAVPPSLGDIVMVDSVKEARSRGVLKSVRPFSRMTETGVIWADGSEESFDAVIWCTGFRPALDHLNALGIHDDAGRIEVENTRAVKEPRLWLLGYGEWCGFGSATLIGVQRYARATAAEIQGHLKTDEDKQT